MHPMLINAVKAARKAGAIINRAAQDVSTIKVMNKTYNDFVSEVDHASEQAIIETLKEAYPNHSFLGEESGQELNNSEYLWIIDPLDGTTNFLHGFPQYAISIALLHNGQLIRLSFMTQPTIYCLLPVKAVVLFSTIAVSVSVNALNCRCH